MTAKNAILLIIKQNPGIDYNTLMNKISSNYKSINSARAALSRSLKDLKIFGYLRVGEHNRLYVTDKTTAFINLEMKNKLLLKLNRMVAAGSPHLQVDSIVEYLHMLIERSKQDADLLKVAKGSTEFYISELSELKEKIVKQAAHLNYLSAVLAQQISSLQQLDFNDLSKEKWNEKTVKRLTKLAKLQEQEEFSIESNRTPALDALSKIFEKEPKGNILFIKKSGIKTLLDAIEKLCSQDNTLVFTLYVSQFKIRVQGRDVYFSAPHSKIKKLVGVKSG